ncbi:MAG: DUF192 domain-containing protein [Dehalococcoidia bacterium]|nr:DUF192 domain-containing protein [Dehalococcoidia bacterium]MSQ17167.1 DUF192 domain-containing protein [Dehalococcoidia bacterium]
MVRQCLACLWFLSALTACGATAAPSPTVQVATPAPAASPTAAPTATGLPAATPDPSPAVTIGEARFLVEVVATPEQRAQGLSGRPQLKQGTGMLFIFEKEGAYGFWMKEMQFPLDLVWISSQCAVVDVTLGAPPPAPGQPQSELPIYTPKAPVLYVLEINAGEAAPTGIAPGKRLALTGSLVGQYGC